MTISVMTLATLAAAVAPGAQPADALPHAFEIKAFASTMAIAKTASDLCATS